ncbi:hypothetical protein MKK75_30825 [Methylobacterium sp. J-030]|uniref:hypothetical protein n=1 Tax=Methylobacterium sp. J-030 TaxID=2836627 RepID=UPI001FBB672D|nr:hypothetical protein [Methylobacterium sp. J-030]MCJ2073128.1 hypothetical protein [Methylobacterium sp. J-030]
MTAFDEASFKEWLHACLDPEAVNADAIVQHASDALTLIGVFDAKTDEQIYIRLFSQKKFRDLTLIKQSQIKKAAILAHHYLKSAHG